MTTAIIVGVIVLVGAVVARATWRRAADERQSVQEHQHTLETLRHMADRRAEASQARQASRAAPAAPAVRRRPRTPSPPRSASGARGADGARSARRAPRVTPAEAERAGGEVVVFVDHSLGAPGAGPAVMPEPGAPRSPLRRPVVAGLRAAPGRSRVPFVTAAVAVVVVAAIVVVVVVTSGPPGHRATARSATTTVPHRPRTGAGAGHGRRSSGAPSSTADVPASETAGAATYAAPGAAYTVVLRATGSCWVLATETTTGRVLWTGTMSGGQTQSLVATGDMALRLGAASDVSVSMDGTQVQLPAAFQSPFTITFQVA